MNEWGFSKAIVTGASGLLGRALIARLLEAEVRVLGVDRQEPAGPPCGPSGAARGGFSGRGAQPFTFYRADVTDIDAWLDLPAEHWKQPEGTVLFHLAGIAHAGYCRQDPLCASAVNVAGALTVVEACRRRGVRRVVFPSTGLVYGPEARVPAAETDPPNPASFYAATKLAAEALLQGLAGDFDLAVDVVRLGNVYGFGTTPDTVHSILLRQAVQGEPLCVKTLRPIRDFIYVKDVAEGMVRLAQSPGTLPSRRGGPVTIDGGERTGFRLFNLSSGRPTSIGKLACVIAQSAGCKEAPQETEPEGPGSISTLVLDTGKLTETLGWRPSWSLEDGIGAVLAQMRQGAP
jgi:nucleoside-diphosphate-sugar epimerase